MKSLTRMTMLAAVIEQLAEGLTDDVAIDRLCRGVMYIHATDPVMLERPMFNKIMIPIFARLIYERHAFEVPVVRYVNALIDFIDEAEFEIVDNELRLQNDQPPGIDQEAEAMEKLADDFKAEYDSEVEA